MTAFLAVLAACFVCFYIGFAHGWNLGQKDAIYVIRDSVRTGKWDRDEFREYFVSTWRGPQGEKWEQ